MNIYVGNIRYTAGEQDLIELFSQYGEVQSAEVKRDKTTQESRGFGFVSMLSAKEAQAAIAALDGKEFMGRTLTVNEARPREQEQSGMRNPGRGAGWGNGRPQRATSERR